MSFVKHIYPVGLKVEYIGRYHQNLLERPLTVKKHLGYKQYLLEDRHENTWTVIELYLQPYIKDDTNVLSIDFINKRRR